MKRQAARVSKASDGVELPPDLAVIPSDGDPCGVWQRWMLARNAWRRANGVAHPVVVTEFLRDWQRWGHLRKSAQTPDTGRSARLRGEAPYQAF